MQQEIQFLIDLLLGGLGILFLFTIAITGGVKPLLPRKGQLFTRWDPKQGLAVIAAFGVTSVWQLFINQIQVTPYLAGLAPQTAFTFKIDNAIAEESAFGSIGIVLYLYFRQKNIFGKITSGLTASLGSAFTTAVIFDYFHNTNLAYSGNPQALLFVFGLRMILTPLQLYTHSLFSGIVVHGGWNALS